jgi:hypothetical protein
MLHIKKVHRSASLKTSHFADPARNREPSPVRKRVCPPTCCSYITNFKTEMNKTKMKLQKAITSARFK